MVYLYMQRLALKSAIILIQFASYRICSQRRTHSRTYASELLLQHQISHPILSGDTSSEIS
jgi:hypothetical protein